MTLILGSESPRRKEILGFFSLPFRTIPAYFDEESVPFHGNPALFAQEVAKGKALELGKKYPNDLILTADTVVFMEGKLYSKPKDLFEAKLMLLELAGRRHKVFTGVSVFGKGEIFSGVSETVVEFHQLTDAQATLYHQAIFPLDKAGGYAIQGAGSLIVKRIEGCYYNVMGLPLETVRTLLSHVGIDLWDYLKLS